MNLQISNDNSPGITGGGANSLYEMRVSDMPDISFCDRGAIVAVSRRAALPKMWRLPEGADDIDQAIIDECGSPILAALLKRRGLTDAAEVAAYLDPAKYEPSSCMDLPDMPRAVARISQAISANEKITIYGDYDVDGVTATAVMISTLRHLGADVDYYIPTRAEGYGLNLKAVSVLASKHRTKLIISCDCGISNFSEINFAKSLGVDTIVVDHHMMPELLPPAAAILHPKVLAEEHPLFHLPGVGVAYKLAEALLIENNEPERVSELLDLVTLGMIADMVPLVKECRYLVQVGMPRLVGTQRAGLKALLQQVGGKDGGTDLVGFGLAPRINAVGRLSDANTAVRLMVTDDAAEATELARQLEYENVRRQELCEEIFAKADHAAQTNIQAGDKAIAIFGEGWHHGVVGIVASRLVEKYHCPVFIGELDPQENIVKGSARGIEGIDLYQVLKANEQLALRWGGHKMAAGFSVEAGKASHFCRALVETCNRHLADKSMLPTLDIDLDVPPGEVSMDLAGIINRMAPFGIANKRPVLAMTKVKCVGSRALGKEGKHSRITVKADSGEQFECVYWNSHGRVPTEGEIVDVAFAPDINTYNGVSRLQLLLNDWRDPNKPVVFDATPAPTISADDRATPASPLHAETIDASPAAGNLPGPKSPPAVHPDSTPHAATPKAGQIIDVSPDRQLSLKDLRNHATPKAVVEAAIRRLGESINVFSELPADDTTPIVDRTALRPSGHLLLWQYPASIQLFKTFIERSAATNVYLVGASPLESEDPSAFLRKLLGFVRFAVNQRDGQADPEKLAAALSTTKMAVALGLATLKKINVIDWFAEDGLINLDILGQPTDKPDQLPEFKQLSKCLMEIAEFRKWCHTAPLSEIQLALGPAAQAKQQPRVGPVTQQDTSGIYQHDTINELPSTIS